MNRLNNPNHQNKAKLINKMYIIGNTFRSKCNRYYYMQNVINAVTMKSKCNCYDYIEDWSMMMRMMKSNL